MEQRDLIKDQIDQLGRALGKIVDYFLALKSSGQITQGIVLSTRQLKSQIDINIDVLLALNKGELQEYLAKRKISFEYFETLANYLFEVGECNITTNHSVAKSYMKKSLELLELMDDISETLSFERINRKVKIEQLLK